MSMSEAQQADRQGDAQRHVEYEVKTKRGKRCDEHALEQALAIHDRDEEERKQREADQKSERSHQRERDRKRAPARQRTPDGTLVLG